MRHVRNKPRPAAGAPGGGEGEPLLRFERTLRGRSLRLTGSRRAIAEAVLERSGHFTIEELVESLRRRGVRGSKATVYRTLPLLTEAGILQAAVVQGEIRSYESPVGREHHDHLVCRRCGRVVEFEEEALERLQREIAARHGFRLEGHHHQLVGICARCRSHEVSPGASRRGRS